jgi:hypothetical protein
VKEELLVKEILGVQSFARVKTGEHYSGPNFFQGDKKMYSAREPEKNPFVFVAAAVFGLSADKAARTVGPEHLAACLQCAGLFGQRNKALFQNSIPDSMHG